MMKSCKHHHNAIDTPERAAETAQTMLSRDFNRTSFGIVVDNPALMAQVITDMAQRQTACCARALYARYLMSIAYREALLPNGWFEPMGQSVEPVEGQLCLLDTGDGSDFAARYYEGDYFADEYNEWPSEDQLISWNEANDYLHEGDDR